MLDSDAPTGATENVENIEDAVTDEVAQAPEVDEVPEGAEVPEVVTPPRRRRAASRPAGPPAPQPEPVAATPTSEAPAEEPPAAELPTAEEPAAEQSAAADHVDAAPAPEPEPQPKASAPRRRRAVRAAGPAEVPAVVPAEPPTDEAPAAEAPARPSRRSRRRPASAEATTESATAPADALGDQLAELAERPTRRRVSDQVANPFNPADVTAALDDLAAAIGGAARPAPSDGAFEDAVGDSPEADDLDAVVEFDDDAGEPGDEDAPRRRRRRRGGRRRRRGADADDATEALGDEDSEAAEGDEASAEPDAAADDESQASEGTAAGRRRRRRRRRGEDAGAETDAEEGVDVVVKVREPRRTTASPSDQITGIEGSTRMEAKRQRRKEGRAAGRRRAPILSEAEFLARRESVERQMLVRQADDYTQIAVLEDGVLVEHYVDRDSAASMIGNVYLGRVQNVLPSMEAAFVDIGRGRNAVIYAGEIDWDGFGVTGADRKVEKVLKSGQAVLVQVTKDPVGAKGARLTSHVSLPGRYVVYAPGGHLSGISRKLPENERARLKGILDEVVGEDASVIVRTAAEGASEEELVRDVNRLKAQWEVIEKKVKAGQAPQQLYSEPDLTVRIVRDLFTEDFGALVIDGNGRGEDAFDTVQAYVTHVAPHLQERLRHWDRASEGDIFEKFRVHEQVAKALERKVHLPSGGSLIIDRTEAMTVVDVNTGRFTGTQGNLEATVTSNNLEAAEEIVRQLRLRDIGGIIVIDFIDMVLPANRELLLRRLVECLGRDRTRHQVAEVTSLGLVQMTRKKIGTGLHEAFTVPCETCQARGYHVHEAPVASQAPADGGDRSEAGRRGRGPAPRG